VSWDSDAAGFALDSNAANFDDALNAAGFKIDGSGFECWLACSEIDRCCWLRER